MGFSSVNEPESPLSGNEKSMVDGGPIKIVDRSRTPTMEHHQDVPEEPSFGELAAINVTDVVDVPAAFDLPPPPGMGDVQLPSANSLGTVLNQALQTDDVHLLETCLQTHDLPAVRATIQRLQPVLATRLLSTLAERMHRRPARAGPLMVWIQWTLIAHGGYLAGQPEIMRQLAALHDVLQDRARALQPLLTLKGKLDMIDAQMQLRKSMQRAQMPEEEEDDVDVDDEEAVIYIEGQDEGPDSDDAEAPAALPDPDVDMVDAFADDDGASDEEDEESEEDMPNGFAVEGHGTTDGSASDDEGFIDDEAAETDGETGEDVDDVEDDDDELDGGESLDDEPKATIKKPKRKL